MKTPRLFLVLATALTMAAPAAWSFPGWNHNQWSGNGTANPTAGTATNNMYHHPTLSGIINGGGWANRSNWNNGNLSGLANRNSWNNGNRQGLLSRIPFVNNVMPASMPIAQAAPIVQPVSYGGYGNGYGGGYGGGCGQGSMGSGFGPGSMGNGFGQNLMGNAFGQGYSPYSNYGGYGANTGYGANAGYGGNNPMMNGMEQWRHHHHHHHMFG